MYQSIRCVFHMLDFGSVFVRRGFDVPYFRSIISCCVFHMLELNSLIVHHVPSENVALRSTFLRCVVHALDFGSVILRHDCNTLDFRSVILRRFVFVRGWELGRFV